MFLYQYSDINAICEQLCKNIKAPFVSCSRSALSSEKQYSIMITVSLEAQKDWVNGILHNSPYMFFEFLPSGALDNFNRSYKIKTKLRMSNNKTVEQVIERINSHIKQL